MGKQSQQKRQHPQCKLQRQQLYITNPTEMKYSFSIKYSVKYYNKEFQYKYQFKLGEFEFKFKI